MDKIHIIDHPLIKHKITKLRMESTGTCEFRKLVEEIAMLLGYEALGDLKTKDIEIQRQHNNCSSSYTCCFNCISYFIFINIFFNIIYI